MDFERLAECFDLDGGTGQARALCAALPAQAPPDWRSLAALLAVGWVGVGRTGAPRVLGISGGQGAGKTTLADLLVRSLAAQGRRAVALSLDDFYLPKSDRELLGRTVHPLLVTRGVPGTHDVALAVAVIDGLRAGRAVRAPAFDKAADDRQPGAGRSIGSGIDLVIFEGWCVGALPQPQAALNEPVNDLERQEDGDGRWRRFVNRALTADYPALWQRLDALLYLQVPDLAAVLRWRTEQEQQHPPARRMSPAAITRFVAHYERLTRWMLATLPATADMVGLLDENHGLSAFQRRKA